MGCDYNGNQTAFMGFLLNEGVKADSFGRQSCGDFGDDTAFILNHETQVVAMFGFTGVCQPSLFTAVGPDIQG